MRKISLLVLLGIASSMCGLMAREDSITLFAESLERLAKTRVSQSLGDSDDEERGGRAARGDDGYKPKKHVTSDDDFGDFGELEGPEKPADKPADKPVDKPIDKPADKPVDKKADKPVVKIEPEPEPLCVDVQAISYLKDLDFKIRGGEIRRSETIPLAEDKTPLTFEPICSKKGVKTESKYTVSFNDENIAEVTCTVGPLDDQYMQVSIVKEEKSGGQVVPITSLPFKTPDAESNVMAEIKLPGVTPKADVVSRVRLTVKMVKEKTKNTFKFSLDAIPTCTSMALIEGKNERTDLKNLEIKLDQSAQQVAVPTGKPYVSLGTLCQEEDTVATRTGDVLVNGKVIAHIDMKLGPKSAETREATIHIIGPDGKPGSTVSGASDEQITAIAVIDGGVRVRVTVLPIKEGFIKLDSKFKIYIQNVAACSTPRARVEVINQRPDLKNIDVIDAYGRSIEAVDTSKRPWILADEICSHKTAEVRETYRLMIGKKEAAQITCIVGPAAENSMQSIITKGADARDLVDPVASAKFTAGQLKNSSFMDVFVPGIGRVKVKVELITELNDVSILINKFKIYLQEIKACESHALVEVINQRKDLTVDIKDNYDLSLNVPDTSKKLYLPVGVICQLPTKDAQETYTLSIGSKPVAKIACIVGPSSGEFLRATITRLEGAKGKLDTVTSADYKGVFKDSVMMPLVVPGVGWFIVKVELIKELGEASIVFNKFKIYVQAISECGPQAWVEVQNQVRGLPVTVEDGFGIVTNVHDISGTNYVTLAPVCQEQGVVAEQRYTLIINNQKMAEVMCDLGPASSETVQATIRTLDASGKQVSEVVGGNYETVMAIVGPTDRERYQLKVIPEKVAGQTKFKWYLQALASCNRAIPVEAQNQTGLSIAVRTQYGKEFDVPNVKQAGYITVDNICQIKTESVEGIYTIKVNNTPVADVFCRFGALSAESHEALIYDYPYAVDKQPLSGSATWGVCSSFSTVGLKLKVEPIWESGIHKFKFYFQPLGIGC